MNEPCGRTVVLSIHDVAPATYGACRRLRELIEQEAGPVPVSLLVVPRYHGDRGWTPDARAWLTGLAEAGDEVVLHGLEHQDAGGRDGREFGPATDGRHAASALAEGRSALAAVGLRPEGFVAPAYGHPPALEAALGASGLRWWATRRQLRSPAGRSALPSIGLGASTVPRRALSPGAAGVAAHLRRNAPAVRLDLHPADLAHPRLAGRVPRLLEALLAQDRRPARHADLLMPG